MWKQRVAVVVAVSCLGALLAIPSIAAKAAPAAKAGKASKAANDGGAQCYTCHDQIKNLKQGTVHAGIACTVCHEKTQDHLANPSASTKPVTLIDQAVCGKCHKAQVDSFYAKHYQPSGDRKEKGVPAGRSPMQDKLLMGHGFTFEHAEPRGHAYMAIDQWIVDRFQGGRYQYKGGWGNYDKNGKAWDVLEDRGTSKRLTESAMAGNPTCVQCKTSDLILKWKFLGEKGGKWDRTSNINDVIKDVQNPLGCIHCHDPHGAQPRVVRDGLIAAIEKNPTDNIFSKNGKTDLKVIDFRGFRKIGIMSKTDSRMMCAQCHVEYNCNTGSQWSDGKPVPYSDVRTNHFPLKNSLQLLKHYRELDFFDFKHAITGARLIKFQHPEAESYAGSKHDLAGVQCHQCHMPKSKGKDGKVVSTHGVIKPINFVKESCTSCHAGESVEKKRWQIETIRNFSKGKMRKAEFWIGELIDTFKLAEIVGVAPGILEQAREKHSEAHAYWEYWTAENSDGFHNPDLLRESMAQSIKASKEGVKILRDAIKAAKK